MSEINSLLNQFHEVPHVGDPIVGTALAVAVTGLGIWQIRRLQKEASESFEHEFAHISTPDHDRLNDAISLVTRQPKDDGTIDFSKNAIGRSKLEQFKKLPKYPMIALLGLAASLGLTFSNPTDQSTTTKQNVVLVVAATNSMIYTEDLSPSQSRYDVGISAALGSSYNGKLGIVSYDQNAVTNVGLSNKSDINANQISTSSILHSGGNLDQGLFNAEQMLGKGGEIIIYSDGTLVNSESGIPINNVISKIEKNGTNVDVIAAGTNNANYSIDGGNPSDSSVNAQNLSFNHTTLQLANSKKLVGEYMNQDLNSAPVAKTVDKEPWFLGSIITLGLTSFGFYKLIKRYLRKIS